MKLKFLIVFVLLLAEMAYMGRMVLDSNDPEVVETVLGIPRVGEWFYEHRMADIREQAEAGDVYYMMALYFQAGVMKNMDDQHLALRLLGESGSAAARMFLFREEGGTIAPGSERDFMLLEARAMKENIRPYLLKGDENEAYVQQSREYARALDTIEEKARSGNPDARWVLSQLEAEESSETSPSE